MSEEIMAREAAAPARTVDVVTMEIQALDQQAKRMALDYAVEIGRRLVEVKGMLHHGEWGKYLKERVGYSQSTANNFMRLFTEFGDEQYSLFGARSKSQTLGNLTYTKALALLVLPEEERENFAQEHDVEGMSTRELQEAVRAREEAEAKAKVAEEARAEMERNMAAANTMLSAANQEAEAAREAREEAEDKQRALEEKLEELERRPVDVAVEVPDPAKMAEAKEEGRREAEMALQAKIAGDQQKKAAELERVREELRTAREAVKAAKEAGKSKEDALQMARDEAQRLKKALEAASNKEIAAFEVYFENVQKGFAALLDQLSKLKRAGEEATHDKLVGAMEALLDAMGKQVPEKVRKC